MFGSLFAKNVTKKKQVFASPFTGELHPIEEAPDEAFAGKMNGDGFMVLPSAGEVLAPADSVVGFVFETNHALGLTAADGLEYLLHIGIDTVDLQGQGFIVYVKAGQSVKKGEKLMEFDLPFVQSHASSAACVCTFTDLPAGRAVSLLKRGQVRFLEDVIEFTS